MSTLSSNSGIPTKKVICLETQGKFFVMEGSANITGVSKSEQSVIYQHRELHDFRKQEIINLVD